MGTQQPCVASTLAGGACTGRKVTHNDTRPVTGSNAGISASEIDQAVLTPLLRDAKCNRGGGGHERLDGTFGGQG